MTNGGERGRPLPVPYLVKAARPLPVVPTASVDFSHFGQCSMWLLGAAGGDHVAVTSAGPLIAKMPA